MNFRHLLKILGPGLLWAGAAIGVSHLVQSTRAGAIYGFELIWLILLINLLKYPFFEFGPRFAAATGKSLLDGYRSLGKWSIGLYFVLTVGTMFTLQAAVTVVTAGLFSSVFDIGLSVFHWTVILLLTGAVIVMVGRYSTLDKLIKFIIVILAVSTLIAVVSAFTKGFHPNPEFTRSFNWEFTDIALLIAFAGWMPSAIDISVWHSLWGVAKAKECGYRPTVKESLFDFNIGYFGTAILSIGFLSLGALIMYGSGNEFSNNGTQFAGQLINLFTGALGGWSYYLIAIAALATMISTTLTCLDAYPRVLNPTSKLLIPKLNVKERALSIFWLVILLSGTIIVLRFFSDKMKTMVDIATTISFLTAPILGYMNYKVINSNQVPVEHRPKHWLNVLSWVGLVALSGMSVYFIIWKFFL